MDLNVAKSYIVVICSILTLSYVDPIALADVRSHFAHDFNMSSFRINVQSSQKRPWYRKCVAFCGPWSRFGLGRFVTRPTCSLTHAGLAFRSTTVRSPTSFGLFGFRSIFSFRSVSDTFVGHALPHSFAIFDNFSAWGAAAPHPAPPELWGARPANSQRNGIGLFVIAIVYNCDNDSCDYVRCKCKPSLVHVDIYMSAGRMPLRRGHEVYLIMCIGIGLLRLDRLQYTYMYMI